MRVFSCSPSHLQSHILEKHSFRARGMISDDNIWEVTSFTHKNKGLTLDAVKSNYSIVHNFRGILWEFLNFKAYDFLREMDNLAEIGHLFQRAKIHQARLKCYCYEDQVEFAIDKFHGELVKADIISKVGRHYEFIAFCLCQSSDFQHFQSDHFTILREFVKCLLKPDYFGNDQTFKKLVSFFVAEKMNDRSIEGTLTILQTLFHENMFE